MNTRIGTLLVQKCIYIKKQKESVKKEASEKKYRINILYLPYSEPDPQF